MQMYLCSVIPKPETLELQKLLEQQKRRTLVHPSPLELPHLHSTSSISILIQKA